MATFSFQLGSSSKFAVEHATRQIVTFALGTGMERLGANAANDRQSSMASTIASAFGARSSPSHPACLGPGTVHRARAVRTASMC